MAEEETKDKKKSKESEFIVETPILIEEKINNSDKVIKYQRGKFLGKGGFAKCYEMTRVDTQKIYAAKVFEKKALNKVRSRKKLINEIKLHKKLHHPNIVSFEHFFEDKENVYILLELCSHQTLNELVKRRKRLTEFEVQVYLLQIIKALKYIHNHRIIHRDLKLGNLFLTNNLELKLGDFGLAAKLEFEGQRRRTLCGTPNYIAPEILEKKNGHSYEVDIWSLGVVAYTMLFGRPPFETAEVNQTYRRIKNNSYTFPENIHVDPSAKRLISSILNLDPSKRPSLDNIMEHDFFKMYPSLPLVLPLRTLVCPLTPQYIAQFTKKKDMDTYDTNFEPQAASPRGMELSSRRMDSNNLNDIEDEHPLIKELESNTQAIFNIGTSTYIGGQQNNIASSKGNFFSKKISKCFDYSSKFGFVYFINNTHLGICFSDFSNIIKHMSKEDNDQDLANTSNYDYIYLEKDGQSTQNFNVNTLERYLGSKNTSKDIVKKFEIFEKVENKHKADFEKLKADSTFINKNVDGTNRLFFIKKYMSSKNATLFRLSNKLVQIIFNDSTEITFSTQTNEFLYKDKEGETKDLIQNAMSGKDQELIKKIKLAKNMMVYFVKSHKSKKLPK